jgi:hypothetical protein
MVELPPIFSFIFPKISLKSREKEVWFIFLLEVRGRTGRGRGETGQGMTRTREGKQETQKRE